MRIMRCNLVGLEVRNKKDNSHLGLVRGVLVSPDNGKLLAFSLNKNFSRVVLASDLIFDEELGHFYVTDLDRVLDSKRDETIAQVLHEKRYFKRQKVTTQTGERVGTMVDFEVDIVLHIITQIFVEKRMFFLLKRRVAFPYSSIIDVERSKIVVDTDKSFAFIKKAEPNIVGSAAST